MSMFATRDEEGFSPEVNQRLDLGFWLPPVFRLGRRALMRQSRELELLPREIEILCRYLHVIEASAPVPFFSNAVMICAKRGNERNLTYMNLVRLNLVAHGWSFRFQRHDLCYSVAAAAHDLVQAGSRERSQEVEAQRDERRGFGTKKEARTRKLSREDKFVTAFLPAFDIRPSGKTNQ